MLFRSLQTKYTEIGKLIRCNRSIITCGRVRRFIKHGGRASEKSRVRHLRNHAHFLFEHNDLNVKTEYVYKVVKFNCW